VWVSVLVPLAVLVLTGVAAVLPAVRAGRMSAVQAIATGRAPRVLRGYRVLRALGRIRWLPRPVTIGLATPFSRPARTLVTVAAVLFGALAVTFGAGLATSLDRVNNDLRHAQTAPVRIHPGLPGPGPGPAKKKSLSNLNFGPPVISAAQQRIIVSALAANPDTLHYVPETDQQLNVPGVPGGVLVTAFGGDASWIGYQLITGRWYSSAAPGSGEADVNTYFLTATGLSVGDRYTLTNGGRSVTVRIVGEVFESGHELDLYTSSGVLGAVGPGAGPGVDTGAGPGAGPAGYTVGVRPGVDPQAYANALSATLGSAADVQVISSNGKEFIAVVGLIAVLTTLLIVVAGLGVLNTVVLQLRERVHDLGVFKSVGMTPRQAIAMVVCSVFVVGLVGGIVAVPGGILLHHGVLPVMAHAANTDLPASVLAVYPAWEIVALALAGLVIAVVGALGPAGWAARTRTAFALRAE
jgi:putative ABC transport system permease protein